MFLSLAFLLALIVSSPGWAEERIFEELKRIQSADPAADLQVAIEKGDYRFRAVIGYSSHDIHAPGVNAHYKAKYGYRVIEGTSDFITEEVRIAIEYAERYNKLLLEKIKKREAEEEKR